MKEPSVGCLKSEAVSTVAHSVFPARTLEPDSVSREEACTSQESTGAKDG